MKADGNYNVFQRVVFVLFVVQAYDAICERDLRHSAVTVRKFYVFDYGWDKFLNSETPSIKTLSLQ